MFGKPLEQTFARLLRDLRESENALRALANRSDAAASRILFRAEHLRHAQTRIDDAQAHLRLAAVDGQSRFKALVDEFEFVQECLWDAYRHFTQALNGPTSNQE